MLAPTLSNGKTDRQSASAIIEAAAPQVRLALRSHPVVNATIISDLLAHALDLARNRSEGPERARKLARDIRAAHERAYTRASPTEDDHAVRFALSQAHDGGRDLTRSTRPYFLNPVVEALEHAHVLALGIAFESTGDLTLDLEHARVLARDLAFERARDKALARAPGRACDLASELVHELERVVGGMFGLDNVERLAELLRRGVLDDFTRADLTNTDLSGTDLSGVLWSEAGTRWPHGMDIERLRRISRSSSLVLGAYVILPDEGSSRTTETTVLR
ncbi:pentapeptide repeat-containing protein [Streptomyces mirabilis]